MDNSPYWKMATDSTATTGPDESGLDWFDRVLHEIEADRRMMEAEARAVEAEEEKRCTFYAPEILHAPVRRQPSVPRRAFIRGQRGGYR